jgi:hypothetical protein
MAAFDSTFRAVGTTLTNLFGFTATYTSVVDGGIDTSTGLPSLSETPQSLIVTPPAEYTVEATDGTVVQIHDMFTLIAGEAWDEAFPTIQPQIGDKMTINNQEYAVVNPNPVYSGEQIAVYKIQLRRG